jgi:hypothetical protein
MNTAGNPYKQFEYFIKMCVYAISLHAVKCKTPNTIAGELVIPSGIEISSIMFMIDNKKLLHKLITCSDNTVLRRIIEMVADVTNKAVETIMQAKQFFLRLDECTDISTAAQLTVFVQVPDNVEILEYVLCCKSPQENATRRAVFQVIIFSVNRKSSGSYVNLYVQMAQLDITGRRPCLLVWMRKENSLELSISVSFTGSAVA